VRLGTGSKKKIVWSARIFLL